MNNLAPILEFMIHKNNITFDQAFKLRPQDNELLNHLPSHEWHTIHEWIVHEVNGYNPSNRLSLQQLLQIPKEERYSFRYFYINGEQALKNGTITFEQFCSIPISERECMWRFFSKECQEACLLGILTLEQFLEIPSNERHTLNRDLFSPNGLKALKKGLISLHQYLSEPFMERFSLKHLFTHNAIIAFEKGLIDFERYRQRSVMDRDSFKLLFSNEGLKLLLNEVITIDEFFNVDSSKRISFLYNHIQSFNEITKNILIMLEKNENKLNYYLPECLQTYIAALTPHHSHINFEKSKIISEKVYEHKKSFFNHADCDYHDDLNEILVEKQNLKL